MEPSTASAGGVPQVTLLWVCQGRVTTLDLTCIGAMCMCVRRATSSLQALLASPNPDDPLVVGPVSDMWKTNPKQAKTLAQQWTKQYAMGK